MFKLEICNSLPSSPSSIERKLLVHWRSLMLLAIGACLPLIIFAKLAVEIIKTDGGLSWELPILALINKTARPQLDFLAATLTPLGVFWGVFPIAVAIALILLKRQQWRSLFYWFVALLGSIGINHTAKLFFHRVRPHLWESFYVPDREYSFPSGHAMSSMTVIAALVILTWETRWRWLVAIVGSLYVLTIAWTRLYLGVHYPSDILAGWMLSIAWVVGLGCSLKLNLKQAIEQQEE